MSLLVAGHTESPAMTFPASHNAAAFLTAHHPVNAQSLHAGAAQLMTQPAAVMPATWAQTHDVSHVGKTSPDTGLSHDMRTLGASPILAGNAATGGVALAPPPALDEGSILAIPTDTINLDYPSNLHY